MAQMFVSDCALPSAATSALREFPPCRIPSSVCCAHPFPAAPSVLPPVLLPPCRNQCAKEDLYYPHPLLQDVLWWTLYQAEPLLLGSCLRGAALRECMKHIHYEVGGWVSLLAVCCCVARLCCRGRGVGALCHFHASA